MLFVILRLFNFVFKSWGLEFICLFIIDVAVIYSGILYIFKKEGSCVIWDIIVEFGVYLVMGN